MKHIVNHRLWLLIKCLWDSNCNLSRVIGLNGTTAILSLNCRDRRPRRSVSRNLYNHKPSVYGPSRMPVPTPKRMFPGYPFPINLADNPQFFRQTEPMKHIVNHRLCCFDQIISPSSAGSPLPSARHMPSNWCDRSPIPACRPRAS